MRMPNEILQSQDSRSCNEVFRISCRASWVKLRRFPDRRKDRLASETLFRRDENSSALPSHLVQSPSRISWHGHGRSSPSQLGPEALNPALTPPRGIGVMD